MIDKTKLSVLNQDELYSITEIFKSFGSMRTEQKRVFNPDYTVCCVSSGRGWGKSFVASAWLASKMLTVPNARCVAIGRTLTDVKQILIDSRDTGVFRYMPYADHKDFHNKSEHRITLPNGSTLTYYGSADIDKLRGSNNMYIVFDEFSSAGGGVALWHDIQMTARVKRQGFKPQTLAISTPKFNSVTKEIHKTADLFIRGSTYDNKDNLSDAFIVNLREQFAGTALEKLELFGEVLDVQNALADAETIDRHREDAPDAPTKRVIAVDPAIEAGTGNSETGVVILAKRNDVENGKTVQHLYVEKDFSRTQPFNEIADFIVDAAHKRNATIVVETNQGGKLCVEILLRSAKALGISTPNIEEVKATESKVARAEVASQELRLGHLHFPIRTLPELESQFCSLSRDPLYTDPKARNDRVDALVHAVRHFVPSAGFKIHTSQK